MAQSIPRRPKLAIAILILGAIVHAGLCGPAIDCRGFPPLDPIWYGITFLWPVPVLISAFFDSDKFGNRRKQLVAYSLVTAFFTAGTTVDVIPRSVDPLWMIMNTIFIGPIHLLITLAVECLAQLFYSFGRQLVEKETANGRFAFSLFSFLCLFSWIGIVLGVPIAYTNSVYEMSRRSAVQKANEDWEHEALVYRDHEPKLLGDCVLEYRFDPETGLKFEESYTKLNFGDFYNERIEELIEEQGLPPYSIQELMPKPSQLIAMLDSTDLDLIDSFPADLNNNISLIREGRFSKWGSDFVGDPDYLSILTPHLNWGGIMGNYPVHTKITDELIFVRDGPHWIGVFLPDGQLIVSVLRSPSSNSWR